MPEKKIETAAFPPPRAAPQAFENKKDSAPGDKSNSLPAASEIFIKEVRVRHFRCLRSVDLELESLTVLIGQNNSGKTSFLNALFAAIGAGQRVISSDDIFLRASEVSPPKDRDVVIDILIRPTDDKGLITDAFPQGSPWLELWGLGIVQDQDDRDLVTIRTSFKWNAVKGEYILERRFLKDWQADSSKWEDSKPVEKVPPVSAQQIEPLALYLLDAKRDIAEDLRSRGSFWSKMVGEHGLTPEDVERIEHELSDINEDIVRSSDVFTHIQSHLRDFHENTRLRRRQYRNNTTCPSPPRFVTRHGRSPFDAWCPTVSSATARHGHPEPWNFLHILGLYDLEAKTEQHECRSPHDGTGGA
jgi:hypothetical protein